MKGWQASALLFVIVTLLVCGMYALTAQMCDGRLEYNMILKRMECVK